MRSGGFTGKFNAIVGLCQRLGIYTEPFRSARDSRPSGWIAGVTYVSNCLGYARERLIAGWEAT